MKTLTLLLAVLTAGTLAALGGCQLAASRGNVGLECTDSGECDDPDLGCVATDDTNPAGTRVCLPPPGDWQCKGKFFGDGACDCGCELQDIDCPDLLASSCANDGNQCPQGQNPKANDNTTCQ